jgi:hypothetical protein
MHFWNTKALAKELRDGTLTERERMKYFLVFMTVLAVVVEIPIYSPEPVSPALIAMSLVSTGITGAGIYITYCANRSGDDKDFIGRFVCLMFPVGVRVVATAIGLYVTYMVIGSIVGGESFDRFTEHTTWIDVAFSLMVGVIFYWRLWHHFNWVSKSHANN